MVNTRNNPNSQLFLDDNDQIYLNQKYHLGKDFHSVIYDIIDRMQILSKKSEKIVKTAYSSLFGVTKIRKIRFKSRLMHWEDVLWEMMVLRSSRLFWKCI